MSRHLTQSERDWLVNIGGCIVAGEAMAEHIDNADAKDFLGQGVSAFTLAMQAMIQDVEQAQRDEILRYLNGCELKVMPRRLGHEGEQLRIVSHKDLRIIADDAVSSCAWCDKSVAEVKGCEKRKAFARIGICGKNRADCPFKGL